MKTYLVTQEDMHGHEFIVSADSHQDAAKKVWDTEHDLATGYNLFVAELKSSEIPVQITELNIEFFEYN